VQKISATVYETVVPDPGPRMPAHEAGALLDTRELGQCAIDSRPLPDSLGSLQIDSREASFTPETQPSRMYQRARFQMQL
jgi:hypothetical protein